MKAQITAGEAFESLTGYDELAIAKAFGAEVTDLAEHKQTTFLRSLIFIEQKRQGLKDREAKEAAMNLTLKDAQSYFIEDEDEDFESGEGEAPFVQGLTTSACGVS